MERKDAESLLRRAQEIKALVVGDLMLDEYLWGKAERISPEAPVQVVDVTHEEMRPGGAGNVINNLAALGCQVTSCSVIGNDEHGALLRRLFTDKGIDVSGVLVDNLRTTSKKTRLLAANQQIVRIDRETREPISPASEAALIGFINDRGADFQVIMVSDYLKGVLTTALLTAIMACAHRHGIPVVIDPKGSDYDKYRGATLLTPNRREAELAADIHIRDEASLQRAASELLAQTQAEGLLITRSEQGMSLFLRDGGHVHIPTVAQEVYDVTGAGDTVLAVLGLSLSCGVPFAEAARLSNVAAGIAVCKVGTSTVTPAEIIDKIGHDHIDSDSKIKNNDVLPGIIAAKQAKGKRVVFTNGCFDLLHAGHVRYLQKARTFGDILVLGLNSDASVRRLKGEKRPLIGETERAHMLAALDCIDYVVIFDEDTPLRLIEALKPFVLVKGGDYAPKRVVGREQVESYGGRLELVEFVDEKSTTNIIDKILERYS